MQKFLMRLTTLQFYFSVLFFILFFLSPKLSLSAQEIVVKGIVSDKENGEPIPGVQIQEENSKLGTISDFDGNYEIILKEAGTLKFKFLGYSRFLLSVEESGQYNVQLEGNDIDLNPVIISVSRRKEKVLDAPASISLIEAKTIKQSISFSPNDLVKNVNGVDIIKTGVSGGSIAVRGFNGLFSNDLLTMVDNRIASIPSLRANLLEMIPTTNDDIERIEILRGPASALYGPNSANGVLHMITKSPIDYQETSVNMGYGFRSKIKGPVSLNSILDEPRYDNDKVLDRSAFTGSLRHSNKLTFRNKMEMGYKISSSFLQAEDWKYNDPNEPDSVVRSLVTDQGRTYFYADGTAVPQDSIDAGLTGDYIDNTRDESTSKYSLDGRVDFRFNKKTELVLASGFNQLSGIGMFPVGASQNERWKYYYGQARFRYDDLYAQVYINGAHSGETYYLNSGDRIIDKSKLIGAQIQHSFEARENLKFIYGADAFLTRPITDQTINGSFEDRDNINEYGAYFQGDYKITPKLSLLAAARADYHSVIDKVFVSPRAAVVYKPQNGHTFRATVNRAFKTPGSGSFFLDLLQSTLPTGIDIRGVGNINGFPFQFADNPYFENQNLAQFRSPYNSDVNTYMHVGDQSINNQAWQGIIDVLTDQFSTLVQNPDLLPVLELAIGALLPDSLENVGHSVKDLNLSSREFTDSDWQNLTDIEPLQNVQTISYELGYKGVIGKGLFLSVNAYRTDTKNYLTPAILLAPVVTLDADMLLEEVGPQIVDQLETLGPIADVLVDFLDTNEDFGGNNNGQVDDELLALLHEAAASLPIGAISPQNLDGPNMIIGSRNIGDITVYGLETNLAFYLSQYIKFNAGYSFVNKDTIGVPGAQFGFVSLNAPKHKLRLGADYRFEKYGLNVGAQFRWNDSYMANSGSFVGEVQAKHEMDLTLAWEPAFVPGLNLVLSVQNLYNNTNPFFVGTPEIGRMSMLRVGYTL